MKAFNPLSNLLSLANSVQNITQHPIIRRTLIVAISSLTILLTAGSCTLPGMQSQRTQTTLGIIKQDPSVLKSGFGRVNNVETVDGQIVSNGLGALSGLALKQVDENTLVYLSRQKGLFVTTNAGRSWKRKYVFAVNKQSEVDQATYSAQIAANDALMVADMAIDDSDPQTMYVAGKLKTLGKIYMTSDQGETFREVYSEVEPDVGVLFVQVDPTNSSHVYALLEGGALIASRDGARTWQKLRSFKDTPVQMGFVKEFGNLFYVLFEQQGLFTSVDNGATWTQQATLKAASEIGETQPKDGLDIPFTGKEQFGSFEKVIPVTANKDGGWLLIADKQLWYNTTLTGRYTKLVLPLQNEQFNLLDMEPDPEQGLDKLYVSIDSKIFLTENRGQSWTTGDLIQISTPIGQIGDILVDKTKPDTIYLMLVQDGTQRGGLFG